MENAKSRFEPKQLQFTVIKISNEMSEFSIYCKFSSFCFLESRCCCHRRNQSKIRSAAYQQPDTKSVCILLIIFCDVILTRLTRLLLDFLTTLTGKLGFIIHFAQ